MSDTDYLLSAPANAERLMEAVVELSVIPGSVPTGRHCTGGRMKPRDFAYTSPETAEAEAKEAMSYPDYREWRAWATGNPYRQTWKSRGVRPEPGVLDTADVELG